mmetsp:Transcript_70774/g.205186  ORF Transcript_70774/g.205186 Transcript_70774/m.205186 type:complete len:210 (-) Transcript_70774:588-1217(-)
MVSFKRRQATNTGLASPPIQRRSIASVCAWAFCLASALRTSASDWASCNCFKSSSSLFSQCVFSRSMPSCSERSRRCSFAVLLHCVNVTWRAARASPTKAFNIASRTASLFCAVSLISLTPRLQFFNTESITPLALPLSIFWIVSWTAAFAWSFLRSSSDLCFAISFSCFLRSSDKKFRKAASFSLSSAWCFFSWAASIASAFHVVNTE